MQKKEENKENPVTINESLLYTIPNNYIDAFIAQQTHKWVSVRKLAQFLNNYLTVKQVIFCLQKKADYNVDFGRFDLKITNQNLEASEPSFYITKK